MLVAALAGFASPRPALAQNFRYEAELGQRSGTTVASSVSGYSGTGYVTSFDNDANGGDYVQLQVDVPDGVYEMWVGYRSHFGPKGYYYKVDADSGSGTFDQTAANQFSADRAGVFALNGGTNTLRITKYWGFYDVDYLEFRPFTPPPLLPVAPTLVDPQADAPTQGLMSYLTSIYGTKTLSGQQHENSKNLSFPVSNYLAKSGGLLPAIRATDLIEYSPSRLQHGANPRNESEETIAWAQKTGGVVTMSWHWNAPTDLINTSGKEWWRGFYTDSTTFDLQAALANPGSPKYNLLLSDIDAIAVQLKKFQTAGVPVIWRPLHEAQGGWFWWGAKGAEPFKQLWGLMHDRLTNYHDLHNLIWEFTSSSAEGNWLDWYPGDDQVDMIGLDVYTSAGASMSGQWYDVLSQYNGKKLIALSETGTLPNPAVTDPLGIDWSYFSPWNGTFVDAFTPTELQNALNADKVLTLDELPLMPWKTYQSALADVDHNGAVDAGDFLAMQRQMGASGAAATADANADGLVNWADLAVWRRQFGQSSAALQFAVPEPGAASLLLTLLVVAMRRPRQSAC
jgi:mannan endo-1,4-beta-mannosidase